ncbi:hypothetical protein TorRG33x02_202800 [Trema orientale]|uniref:Uncharacterized protein n=1 Tax=Trema orientale TaxID=63057 RepID=A0A2P5EEP7_TREOI|nr:hypothetical protein TorRG33x02_202800 [Trema orientale]
MNGGQVENDSKSRGTRGEVVVGWNMRMAEVIRATTVEVRERAPRASTTLAELRRMSSTAASVRLWAMDWGRSMEGRVKKEIGTLIWDIVSIYKDVVAVSDGMVVTKIVTLK